MERNLCVSACLQADQAVYERFKSFYRSCCKMRQESNIFESSTTELCAAAVIASAIQLARRRNRRRALLVNRDGRINKPGEDQQRPVLEYGSSGPEDGSIVDDPDRSGNANNASRTGYADNFINPLQSSPFQFSRDIRSISPAESSQQNSKIRALVPSFQVQLLHKCVVRRVTLLAYYCSLEHASQCRCQLLIYVMAPDDGLTWDLKLVVNANVSGHDSNSTYMHRRKNI